MLKLKTVTTDEAGSVVATYVASHKDKTTDVAADVLLRSNDKGASADFSFTSGDCDTEELAFNALADHLEGVAKALRARGEPKLGVPVYG